MARPLPGKTGEVATLAGGCFWCLEPLFQALQGVWKVESGYSGGQDPDPTYEEVCTGKTGHAEVIQVTFDPGVISYKEILGVFFSFHDPTTLDRQGGDVGTQYRSAIFYHSPGQKKTARRLIDLFEREKVFADPVVTLLEPYTGFYPAEEYHQDYFRKNPGNFYCQAVIPPKLAKLRKEYPSRLKKS